MELSSEYQVNQGYTARFCLNTHIHTQGRGEGEVERERVRAKKIISITK